MPADPASSSLPRLKTRSRAGQLVFADTTSPALRELQSDFTSSYLQSSPRNSLPNTPAAAPSPPTNSNTNSNTNNAARARAASISKQSHQRTSSSSSLKRPAPKKSASDLKPDTPTSTKARIKTASHKAEESSAIKPAPAGTKRVKGKRVSRPFIFGSEAWNLPKPGEPGRPPDIPDEHTKGWRVFVRTPEGAPDISSWLKQVQFKLHPTYANNVRIIKDLPFEVQETGWGGFHIEMRPYIQGSANEKGSARLHWLQLEPYGTEEEQAEQTKKNLIRSQALDYIEFNEPVEVLYEALQDPGQWDYLKKNKNPGSIQWTSDDLPEAATDGNPYNKQMEESLIVNLQAALKKVDEVVAEEEQRREEIKKKVTQLNAEIAGAKKSAEK